LSIPFYFAMEENETEIVPGVRYAQLGFGFSEDDTLRFPEHRIPNAPAVINDRFLPATTLEPKVLDQLAEACQNGCILDFERPVNEVSAAIAVGLQKRLNQKIVVPPMLRRICPDALVQIPGLLCNHWEKFMQRIQAQYRNRWVLEIIPWHYSLLTKITTSENGYLREACCSYHILNGKLRYYDTQESIDEKISIAEHNGCQAAITLLREYTQNAQLD